VALRAAKIMHAMLMRGFTTVRDLGGAELRPEDGSRATIIGPPAGHLRKAVSQTAAHRLSRALSHRNVDYYATKAARLAARRRVDAVRRIARRGIKAGRISFNHGQWRGLVAEPIRSPRSDFRATRFWRGRRGEGTPRPSGGASL